MTSKELFEKYTSCQSYDHASSLANKLENVADVSNCADVSRKGRDETTRAATAMCFVVP